MHDVRSRTDIELIVAHFYDAVMADSIIGFIFVDVAKIDLKSHLPTIVDFWQDAVLSSEAKKYSGNVFKAHLELAQNISLRPGHFTRWLYLFERAVDAHAKGEVADTMKRRAHSVAKTIAAALSDQKRGELRISLAED